MWCFFFLRMTDPPKKQHQNGRKKPNKSIRNGVHSPSWPHFLQACWQAVKNGLLISKPLTSRAVYPSPSTEPWLKENHQSCVSVESNTCQGAERRHPAKLQAAPVGDCRGTETQQCHLCVPTAQDRVKASPIKVLNTTLLPQTRLTTGAHSSHRGTSRDNVSQNPQCCLDSRNI